MIIGQNKNNIKGIFTMLTTVQPNTIHSVHKNSFLSLEWMNIYTVQMKCQAESAHVLRAESVPVPVGSLPVVPGPLEADS